MQNSQKTQEKITVILTVIRIRKQMLRFTNSQQKDYTDYSSWNRTARIASYAAVDFCFFTRITSHLSFFWRNFTYFSPLFATIFCKLNNQVNEKERRDGNIYRLLSIPYNNMHSVSATIHNSNSILTWYICINNTYIHYMYVCLSVYMPLSIRAFYT